jgi:MFS family permease
VTHQKSRRLVLSLRARYAENRRVRQRIAHRSWKGLAGDALPAITVATLIPMGLFYTAMALSGTVQTAIFVALAWSCAAFAVHYRRHGRAGGLLTVTLVLTLLRVATSFAASSTFVYFVVPIASTGGFALSFVTSLFVGEPLIVRLARDFVPSLAPELATRRRLVVCLSLVWALVYLASGATAFTLLTTQSTTVYVGVHVIAGWGWVAAGVVATAAVCRRMAADVLTPNVLTVDVLTTDVLSADVLTADALLVEVLAA